CLIFCENCNTRYKLSNETGNVAPDLAVLRRRDLEGRFCFKLGHSATDNFVNPQHAYEDSVFSRAQKEESRLKMHQSAEDFIFKNR
ncbi:hypothetical protein NQ318_008841, partial [Aromia moschata]